MNLTASEQFLAEKRPFFLEGAGLFQMSIGDEISGEALFYSRRIGRTPLRRNYGVAVHRNVPDVSRIIGAVLRWEGRPGSALFVVWSQGRGGFDAEPFSLATDGGRLFAEPSTNVLLVKLSYWFVR